LSKENDAAEGFAHLLRDVLRKLGETDEHP
jgi:hypothetical protein